MVNRHMKKFQYIEGASLHFNPPKNKYNFGRVNAIDFPFSTLHNTPSLYVNVNVYFRVLHKLRVDVMRPDYPWGSKLPHLQVGASNSFQTQCVGRGVLLLLSFSVRFLSYPLRRYSCAKLMHFPAR